MTEYVYKLVRNDEEVQCIDIWFQNEMDQVLKIGDKMYELNEEAYMNGYNWDALINYYLAKHAPEVLEGLDSDPEAGSYMARYEYSAENEKKADKFVKIIKYLIENEAELYRIVKEESDQIEWD